MRASFQTTAVVLFAHGSRDPQWRAPMDAVAGEMRQLAPHMAVCCAFLELMAPSLGDAVDALVKDGHRAIRIVPMFLGIGRHAREDLPALCADLRQRHPDLVLDLQPALGEQAEMVQAMARLALRQDNP